MLVLGGCVALVLAMVACYVAAPMQMATTSGASDSVGAMLPELSSALPSWTYQVPLPRATFVSAGDKSYCEPWRRVRTRVEQQQGASPSLYGVVPGPPDGTVRDIVGIAAILPYECIGDDGSRLTNKCSPAGAVASRVTDGFLQKFTETWSFLTSPRSRRFRAAIVYVGRPNVIKRGRPDSWEGIRERFEGGAADPCDGLAPEDPRLDRLRLPGALEVRAYLYEYVRGEFDDRPALVSGDDSRIPYRTHLEGAGLASGPVSP